MFWGHKYRMSQKMLLHERILASQGVYPFQGQPNYQQYQYKEFFQSLNSEKIMRSKLL